MRTKIPHIVGEDGVSCCPYCDNDHDPGIQCRFMPQSVRFQLPDTPPPAPRPKPQRITDSNGKLIAVKRV